MLSKLIKHEFRNSWRLILILNVAAIVLAFCVMLLIRGYAQVYPFMFREDAMFFDWEDFYAFLSTSFIILYVVFMIAANVIVYLFLSMRFYREIYSEAGYLMHALPVTKGQLLWSHLICSGLWLLEFALLDVVCILIALAGIPEAYAVLFREFGAFAAELMAWAAEHPVVTVQIVVMIALTLLSWLLAPFAQMLQTYCAISLGQVFKTHRVIGAVVMYFVISFATGIASQVLAFILMMSFGGTMARMDMIASPLTATQMMLGIVDVAMVIALFFSAALCVGFFLITHHWMKNRLNLE